DSTGAVTNTSPKDADKRAAVEKCEQIAFNASTGCLIDKQGNMTTVAGRTENAAERMVDKTKEVARSAVDKTKAVAATAAARTERAVDNVGERTERASDTA